MSGSKFASAGGQPHAIIGGYGLPGRCIAELLQSHQIPYCVIDVNPATAARCGPSGPCIIVGDMRDETILQQAGIHQARLVAVTVPDDKIALEITQSVRRLRPDVPIVVRCAYTSAGLKARQLGATGVIVAEQLIAQEFARLIEASLSRGSASPLRS